jgi:hypothetical protein
MPRPCDGCRYCPTTYPSRGATGDEVERSRDIVVRLSEGINEGWPVLPLGGHVLGAFDQLLDDRISAHSS